MNDLQKQKCIYEIQISTNFQNAIYIFSIVLKRQNPTRSTSAHNLFFDTLKTIEQKQTQQYIEIFWFDICFISCLEIEAWKTMSSLSCSTTKITESTLQFVSFFTSIPRGLMARIPGFHPGGPGSIPGVGVQSFFSSCLLTKQHASSSILFLYYNFNWPTDIELFVCRVTSFGMIQTHMPQSFSFSVIISHAW